MKTYLVVCSVTVCTLLAACGGAEKKQAIVIPNVNKIFQINSTDMDTLAVIMHVENYKPYKVHYNYWGIDNSGEHEQTRLTVPGPSDMNLKVLMYFDSATFNKLAAQYCPTGSCKDSLVPSRLDWLTEQEQKEIAGRKALYLHTDHEVYFFDNKGLFHYSSNHPYFPL